MKRIGILGGTFNPIHIGHLVIAELSQEKLMLDKVLFVPSYYPPHKSRKNVISAKHRYRLVDLAIRHNQKFAIDDFEVRRKGKSYSYETICHLKSQYPKGTKFYFIIGEDMVSTLGQWRNIKDILKMVTFVVVNREGFKSGRNTIKYRSFKTCYLDIASSEIRYRLRSGKSIRYFVPEKVIQYLKKNNLYRSK